MLLRTLIVDDEPVARRVLREELEAHASIEIVGEAQNGLQAVDLVRTLQPDLVFLDLQMPGLTGFEALRKIESAGIPLPVVVVVTAYDQHAVEALDAGAVDYLLKPVAEDRLRKAIDRALALKGKPGPIAESVAGAINAATPPQTSKGRKVVGRSGAEYFLLDLPDVLAFTAEGEIVWIITARQKYYATQTLRAIQQKLPVTELHRVHRNAIVNVNHIRKMASMSSQRWLLTLSNGLELIVSKRLAQNVRSVLEW